jgi:hypothetical protein
MLATAVIWSAVVGFVVQNKASKRAAAAQTQAADKGIEEQRRQFDRVQELLSPYVEAGDASLIQQMALGGMSGAEAQREAISAIEGGQEFQTLTQQGEEAILQSASATGGLRGGNTQAALAQFRPQVLSSLINQQYSRLGGLTAMGQQSAAGVGTAGMQTGQNIANLYGQQGAAAAGSALASGQAFGNVMGSIGQYAGGISAGIFENPFGGARYSTNVVSGPMTSSLRPQMRPSAGQF